MVHRKPCDPKLRRDSYMRTRIEQLLEEAEKCSSEWDAQWYRRIAQELKWVLDLGEHIGKPRDRE